MAGIGGILKLIQQQQALEESKRQADEDMALSLLQIELGQDRYSDELSATYGADNIIVDDVTGRSRMKSAEEGLI